MNAPRHPGLLFRALPALILCGWISGAPAAEPLVWQMDRDQVDAEMEAWPLPKVLSAIASATGWDIYVEPDTRYTVTTRFRNLKIPEALRRLLGELNFALIPQTNGPARLFVYQHSVQDATRLIEAPNRARARAAAPRPVPGELIVRLKPGADEDIDALARRLGAKVTGRIDDLNAYRLEFEDEDAARRARAELESDTDVASVEDNLAIPGPGDLVAPAPGAPPPPPFKLNPPDASGRLVVALVDTAVQSQGAPWADNLLDSMSLAGDAPLDSGQISHGTAMMDTLWNALGHTLTDPGSASVAFLTFDVYGSSSSTTMFDVARAIIEAVNQDAKIVNLSLGGMGQSALLNDVLKQARARDVLLIAAAGNEHDTRLTIPAANENVLAVTAGDRHGEIAGYANYGDFVDIIAPGASLVNNSGQTFLIVGTSAAAANTSGAAAGLAINLQTTPMQAVPGITELRGFSPVKRP